MIKENDLHAIRSFSVIESKVYLKDKLFSKASIVVPLLGRKNE